MQEIGVCPNANYNFKDHSENKTSLTKYANRLRQNYSKGIESSEISGLRLIFTFYDVVSSLRQNAHGARVWLCVTIILSS